MQLSDHFTLEELTFSQTATRQGIDNTPGEQEQANLKRLCTQVLEPLRALVRQPLHVSSGYRSPRLNAAIGGSANSQHMEGKAADIVCPVIGTPALFKAVVQSQIDFDQLIFEGTWVHVSYNQGANRQQIMRANFRENAPTTYTHLTRDEALRVV